jgi:hypothetical protein
LTSGGFRSIRLLPLPPCPHKWRPHGKHRDGRPRFRCRMCGRTRVGLRLREFGMYLTPGKIKKLKLFFVMGLSTRAAARRARVAQDTVSKLRRLLKDETPCPCGQPSGHRGWCTIRFAQSKPRQEWMRHWHD